MAEYIIDKIEYGGNVYKLQDNVSDFLTGAVTSLSTTEGHHSTITNQNGAVSVAIPTNTSHLTNDSGFVRQFKVTVTESNGTFSADKTFTEIQTAYNQGYEVVCHCMEDNSFIPFLALNNEMVQFELSAMTSNGTPAAEYVQINNTNEVTHQFLNFTETDPSFRASPAAGITATDITNWNAKVSDTGKWNGVALGSGRADDTSDLWIPSKSDNNNDSGTAYWIKTTQELPASSASESVQIPRYKKINGQWYLQSTTPSANDNSTKVATTAYVDAAMSGVTTVAAQIIRWGD